MPAHKHSCLVCSCWIVIVFFHVCLGWLVGSCWLVFLHLHSSWCLLVFDLGVCWCLLDVGVCWCSILGFVGVCWCFFLLIHVPKCAFVFIPVHFFNVCSSLLKLVQGYSCSIIFIHVQLILNQKCYIQPVNIIVSLGPFEAFVQLFQVCISSASSSYPTSFIAQVVQQHLAP